MTPTGRAIHEKVLTIAQVASPLTIGILETPTGFEVNAIASWPQRMEDFFQKGLQNLHPQITRIRAWHREGPWSTNDPAIVDSITNQKYLYCGAGSPSYVITHLKETLAFTRLMDAHLRGAVLALGSATAVAAGTFALPVYEIFKAGHPLHWMEGLNLFGRYRLDLAVVPHWNNKEGEDFDTTRCWMGKARFTKLAAMLPQSAVVVGIDETTACVIDVASDTFIVLGKGSVHVMKGKRLKQFTKGTTYRLDELR